MPMIGEETYKKKEAIFLDTLPVNIFINSTHYSLPEMEIFDLESIFKPVFVS
jgi:hypothetical protein